MYRRSFPEFVDLTLVPLSRRSQILCFFVQRPNHCLNRVNRSFLKIGLSTLLTDPSRNLVNGQMNPSPVNMKGHLSAIHYTTTVHTFHFFLLTLKPSSQFSMAGI